MTREATFRGQVFENTGNDQKLITAPQKSGVDVNDTVKVVSLGEFHEAMSPEGTPAHYAHAELRAAMKTVREAVDLIPDGDIEELDGEHDFYETFELDVQDGISEMVTAIDKHFGVTEGGNIDQDRLLLEHKMKTLLEDLQEIDSNFNEERDQLKEDYGVKEIEYLQGSFNLITTENGETVEVPAYIQAPKDHDGKVKQLQSDHGEDAPEDLKEFSKKLRLKAVKQRKEYREAVEAEGLEFDMTVVGMDALVMKIRNGDYVAEVPYYFAEEHNMEIYREEKL